MIAPVSWSWPHLVSSRWNDGNWILVSSPAMSIWFCQMFQVMFEFPIENPPFEDFFCFMTGSWPPKCDVFCKRRTLLWTTNSFLLTKCWFHLLNIVGGHRLMNCAVSDGQTLLEGTVIRTNSSDFWLQVGNCAQLHLFTMTVSPFLATYWPTCSRVQVDFSGPFLYPIARCNDTKILN
jgi:hypothetical protein